MNVTWTKFTVQIGNPLCSLRYRTIHSILLGGMLLQWMEFLWAYQLKDIAFCTLTARDTHELGLTISWLSKWPWAHMCEREQYTCKGYNLRTTYFLLTEPKNKSQCWLHHNCAVTKWAYQSPEEKLMNTCHFSFGYTASKPSANVYENFHLSSAKEA